MEVTLIGAVLWAYVCYKMALNRGRDGTLGALLGFMFGLFSVAGYAIAGQKKKGRKE